MVPILPIVCPVTERFLQREAATTEERRLTLPSLYDVALVIDQSDGAFYLVGPGFGDGYVQFGFRHRGVVSEVNGFGQDPLL